MKRAAFLCCALAIVFFLAGAANATMMLYNDQVVWEDMGTADVTDDLFFYRDLSRFTEMTFAEQVAEMALLDTELAGIGPWNNDWHHVVEIPEVTAIKNNATEVVDLFLPSYDIDFIGRIGTGYEDPDYHHVVEHLLMDFGGGPHWYTEQYLASDEAAYAALGAWAVATYGGPVAVPEPATVILLFTGLIGLVGSRGRQSRKRV